jgi:sigma-B regulation protein RsbU (phosphoserine phosphatase)
MHILVAEDDPIVRRLLQYHLNKWGHEVIQTQNGEEAWQAYQNYQFQMVISDWMMPGIDGIEFIKRIRASNNSAYIYTILLTSKGRKEDLIEGMEAGADDFLVKPMDTEELKVKMRAGQRIIELEQRLAQKNRELKNTNDLMKKDLLAAAKIQESLLPKNLPELNSLDVAWIFQPCDELAGDFLNVFPIGQDFLAFYILDVSGHGVSAALLSVTLSRLLSANPLQSNVLVKNNQKSDKLTVVPPQEVAKELNQKFPLDPETGQYFTFLYGIIDIVKMNLQFVSAGHPGIVYLPKNGEPRILDSPGLPIGVVEKPEYTQQSLPLQSGDKIILYSDGIVEALNREGHQFGKKRFMENLLKIHRQPLQKYLEQFIKTLTDWCGGKQLQDDVTMIAVEVMPT